MLLLLPGFLLVHGPPDLTAGLLPMHYTFLPDLLTELQSIGNRFSPVHFRGQQSRLVICYELFKGWLLLSQPSNCFRLLTHFIFNT